jgi:hypothetical protein
MTNIIDIAREVGSPAPKSLCGQTDYLVITPYELESFAEFVRADEREALGKLDWTAIMREGGLVTWGDADELGDRVLDILRNRSNT